MTQNAILNVAQWVVQRGLKGSYRGHQPHAVPLRVTAAIPATAGRSIGVDFRFVRFDFRIDSTGLAGLEVTGDSLTFHL